MLRWLAKGPSNRVRYYTGFDINGIRFHTQERDNTGKCQNSGILVTAQTPDQGMVSYYGIVKDMIYLNYYGQFGIVLFKCDWINIFHKDGLKVDKHGFTLVNLNCLLRTEEPFVFASQAQQVFYIGNPREKSWHVVVKTKPRDTYVMGDEKNDDIIETLLQSTTHKENVIENILAEIGEIDISRKDVDAIELDWYVLSC